MAKWQQKWRERFAAELFLDTGKWILRGLDWHVLAGYDDVCVKERALERYTSIEEGPFLVVSRSSDKDFGFSCTGRPPIITIKGFNWTMAQTHSSYYGPFFVRVDDEDPSVFTK